MSNFFVLGLPRSRTTWLSAFLISDKVFCEHEVFSGGVDCPEEFWGLEDYDYLGSVDTDAVLATPYLHDVDAPLVIIERDHRAVYKSLASIPHTDTRKLKRWFKRQVEALEEAKKFANLVVPYNKLDDMLEELSYVCTPDIAFDKVKHTAFKNYNIQMPALCGKSFNRRMGTCQQQVQQQFIGMQQQ